MRLRFTRTQHSRLWVTLRVLSRMLVLTGRAAPLELRNLLLANVIIGAGPAVLLYLGKRVIDETIALAGEQTSITSYDAILATPALIWSIAGFIIVNILLDSVDTLRIFASTALRDRVLGTVKSRIHRKIAEFEDIALFESPELLDTLQLAQQSLPRFRQLSTALTEVTTGLFVMIPVLALSFSIAWWVPVVIFCSSVPSIWVQMHYGEQYWSIERSQTLQLRQLGIYERVLTEPNYAKDLRQLGLQQFFLNRWNWLFWKAFEETRQVRQRGSFVVIAWSALTGLGTGLPYLYVVAAALNGRYSPGDLALYAGLVFQVRRSLYALLGTTTNLQEIALSATAFFQLLDLKATLQRVQLLGAETAVTTPQHRDAAHEIAITDVSFAYPSRDSWAIQNINLKIRSGELVIVVGENGAGKTTLAKLLCRLYDPQNGAIRWAGKDIREFDLATLRREITVMNQDYARFPATLRENILFGALDQKADDNAILQVAEAAGLGPMLGGLPRGLDTPLSTELEHGIDPSGGQWQRLALARALLRQPQSKLVLLDEPTAALDPKTEHETFGIFREMARDKITIVISHRLALARLAHRIVVMERGRIVEMGTHELLMKQQGVYYELFMRQASSYLPEDRATTW